MAKPQKTAAERRRRNGRYAMIGAGAAVVASAAALVGIFANRRGWMVEDESFGKLGDAEHPAPDLALDQPHPGPDARAPEAFRPDPTAPVPDSERDALRPATGPAPTLVGGRDDVPAGGDPANR